MIFFARRGIYGLRAVVAVVCAVVSTADHELAQEVYESGDYERGRKLAERAERWGRISDRIAPPPREGGS